MCCQNDSCGVVKNSYCFKAINHNRDSNRYNTIRFILICVLVFAFGRIINEYVVANYFWTEIETGYIQTINLSVRAQKDRQSIWLSR